MIRVNNVPIKPQIRFIPMNTQIIAEEVLL